MVDQLQTNGGQCVTKDGVVPSGTDADCCCDSGGGTHACFGTCVGPDSVQVVISGVTNGSCGSCSSMNGTFVLAYNGIYASGGYGGCWYIYDRGSQLCGDKCRYLHVHLYSYLLGSISVTWNFDAAIPGIISGAPYMQWADFGVTLDCPGMSSYSVPYWDDLGAGCNPTSATCLVTSL